MTSPTPEQAAEAVRLLRQLVQKSERFSKSFQSETATGSERVHNATIWRAAREEAEYFLENLTPTEK